ncbi:ROK family protein [Tepidamorphus gemmatus]|uniref:ROK family protein n=1 Tax=Tepidamorphus gemmatus TaxID=747076 RepID=UPI001A9DEAEB|nr:ROK family protein [Tepidamorphus gemmatus]
MRVGVDLGGTKIAAIALDADGAVVGEARRPAPRDDYRATVEALADIVAEVERQAGARGSIGIGMPGSISPVTGRIQNSNSVWLNGTPFAEDVQAALARPARFANDADCFALSEATDGAGAGASSVFGAILGTGCGGGIVVGGRLLAGPNRSAGEWGHSPLPWPVSEEYPGPICWCGRRGCLETWVSGTGMQMDHAARTGEALAADQIVARAPTDPSARETLERHLSRLARALAVIVNTIDPDVIVLGGGLSQMPHLYDRLPDTMRPHIFAAAPLVTVRPPRHGDASGVRGAARLWRLDETG